MRIPFGAKVAGLAAVVVGVVLLWVLTPVRDYADPDAIQALIEPLTSSPFLPLYVLAAFEIAGLIMLSVWLIIFQTCLLFPPAAAFPLALGGATLSAVTFYGLGRLLGRDVVERMAPPRVQRAVGGATLESIIAIRVLPLLPFSLVNMACGAFNVRFSTFVIGTAVGMAPGVLGMTLLGDSLLNVIRNPTPQSIGALLGVAVVLVGTATFFRRRAARRAGVDDATTT